MYRILISSLTLTVIIIALISYQDEPYTSTQMFCAYGKVFVEFNEGKHKWGALWLDRQGLPVPCENNDTEKYEKESYDKSV